MGPKAPSIPNAKRTKKLTTNADGQLYEPQGKRAGKKQLEVGGGEFVVQGGGVGKLGDALGKISEGVTLSGHKLSHQRHEVVEI